MAKKLTIALALAGLLALAVAFGLQERRVARAERDAGLAASRTLSAVFARAAVLKVATLSGEAVTRVEGSSGFGMFANVQTTRAPYTVDYTLDLSRLGASDYRWNPQARVMVVTVPEVTVGKPTIDLAEATTQQNGLYISRKSGLAMQQHVAANLALLVSAKASAPENLARAQTAARSAVAALVAPPLAAAGLGRVRVVVRLPGEAKPAGLGEEQWDLTKPIAEVLGDSAD